MLQSNPIGKKIKIIGNKLLRFPDWLTVTQSGLIHNIVLQDDIFSTTIIHVPPQHLLMCLNYLITQSGSRQKL